MANVNGNPLSAPASGNPGFYFRQGQAVLFTPTNSIVPNTSVDFTVGSGFIEYSIHDDGNLGDSFALSWAMTCANDVIQGLVTLPSTALNGTPLPAALPLFAGGLGVMGLLAGRRKRKSSLCSPDRKTRSDFGETASCRLCENLASQIRKAASTTMRSFFMGYVQGEDRGQAALLPAAIEDYVVVDAPVRVIDAFVDGLDVRGLGFGRSIPAATGRPPYDPRDLLKLYLYGYLNEVRSSPLLKGLSDLSARPKQREPSQTQVVDLGRMRLSSIDNISESLAIAEGETFK